MVQILMPYCIRVTMAIIREYRDSDFASLKRLISELHEALRPFDKNLAPVE